MTVSFIFSAGGFAEHRVVNDDEFKFLQRLKYILGTRDRHGNVLHEYHRHLRLIWSLAIEQPLRNFGVIARRVAERYAIGIAVIAGLRDLGDCGRQPRRTFTLWNDDRSPTVVPSHQRTQQADCAAGLYAVGVVRARPDIHKLRRGRRKLMRIPLRCCRRHATNALRPGWRFVFHTPSENGVKLSRAATSWVQ